MLVHSVICRHGVEFNLFLANRAAFEKEIEGMPSTRSVGDLPPELRCPLCNDVMKDAVLTSKCCFKSFCDRCMFFIHMLYLGFSEFEYYAFMLMSIWFVVLPHYASKEQFRCFILLCLFLL